MWSRDELTGGNVLNPVTALHRRTTAEMSVLSLLVEDEAGPLLLAAAGAANDKAPRATHEVRLTPEHPVYVAGRNGEALGWIMAGELVPGDEIADIDGGALVKVVDNALTETEEIVYNFEVESAHSRSRGSTALEHRLDLEQRFEKQRGVMSILRTYSNSKFHQSETSTKKIFARRHDLPSVFHLTVPRVESPTSNLKEMESANRDGLENLLGERHRSA